jgi:hypothetical protein
VERLQEKIAELEDAGNSWQLQCEKKAFGEHDDVLYRQLQKDLEMYKHMASEQQMQLEVAEQEVSNLKGWAAEEVRSIAMYVEERDWYRCQATALEAKPSSDLQVSPAKVPFRPNWKSMGAQERKSWSDQQPLTQSEGDKAFESVVEEYLASELSDHAKLQEREEDVRDKNMRVREGHQARQEEEHEQAQAFSTTPVMAELPSMPVFPTMPNLPA